jgi:hypothetical protein
MERQALRRLMPDTGQSFELVNQLRNRFSVFKHLRDWPLIFGFWSLVASRLGLAANTKAKDRRPKAKSF